MLLFDPFPDFSQKSKCKDYFSVSTLLKGFPLHRLSGKMGEYSSGEQNLALLKRKCNIIITLEPNFP